MIGWCGCFVKSGGEQPSSPPSSKRKNRHPETPCAAPPSFFFLPLFGGGAGFFFLLFFSDGSLASQVGLGFFGRGSCPTLPSFFPSPLPFLVEILVKAEAELQAENRFFSFFRCCSWEGRRRRQKTSIVSPPSPFFFFFFFRGFSTAIRLMPRRRRRLAFPPPPPRRQSNGEAHYIQALSSFSFPFLLLSSSLFSGGHRCLRKNFLGVPFFLLCFFGGAGIRDKFD